jgi:pimeloyl-ACP methyl ester carboxylesterase
MAPSDRSSGTVHVPATGVDLGFETFGSADAVPVVLLMGLGTQMIAWPEELCESLAADGSYVVRFDNRDVGLSTHFDGLRAPSPQAVLFRRARPPYAMDDMADDTIGLFDAFGFASAHLVGASMGGFIAQTVALKAPKRVRSLTLIMTSTGSVRVGRPHSRVVWRSLRRKQARTAEEAIDAVVDTFRLIGSPGYAFDERHFRDLARQSLERGNDPGGFARQLAAVLAQPNRTRQLRGLSLPTTVVHGLSDPLVDPSGGRALARAIPGARFIGIPGMGHDLPRQIVPRLAEAITSTVREGERQSDTVR